MPAESSPITKIEPEVEQFFKIKDMGLFVSRVISIALTFAGLIAVVFLIWGGIQWILSGGDKAKYEEARNRITAALIGLTIVVLVWLLWQLILYFLGVGTILDNKVILPLGSEASPPPGGAVPPPGGGGGGYIPI